MIGIRSGGIIVEYLTYVLLLALAGFLLLLTRYDLTPRLAMYKLSRRFFRTKTKNLLPGVNDAPYRRIRTGNGLLHKPVILNLETSEGTGQACHPDVAYIPQGFGLGKWPYWLVCTPLPYETDGYENPELFASYDGITWEVPRGAINPLAPSPAKAGDHHSDPDMIFHHNILWLFFRKTKRNQDAWENKIFLIKSADGVNWSSPVEVLCDEGGTELMSPAVVHDGKNFLMWTIDWNGKEFIMARRTSRDGMKWSKPAPGRVDGLEPGRTLWHIDVIQETDRLSALLVTGTGGGRKTRIHYAYSLDEGYTWIAGPFLLELSYEFEAKRHYRSTFRKVADYPPRYELWYSATSVRAMSSIAYVRLIRSEENLLYPCNNQKERLTAG